MPEKNYGELTVGEILEMFPDPFAYFNNLTRNVSENYKRHALEQLKKDFRYIGFATIRKEQNKNKGLYYPSYKALKKLNPSRFHCATLLRMQRKRINHMKELEDEKQSKKEAAKANGQRQECECCFNDECLPEEMLPCRGGHFYCTECVQRAAEVNIIIKCFREDRNNS
jgi:hypothetical protein